MIEVTVDRDFEVIKDVKEIDDTFEDPYMILGKILASSFVEYMNEKDRKEA